MEKNQFIKRLLKEGEVDQLELIGELDLEKVATVVCGFLNQKGGRVIIGVNDKKKIQKIRDFDESLRLVNSILFNEIVPSSIIGIRKEQYENEPIILIEVIEGNKKPYSFENRTFIRVNGNTRAANEEEMGLIIRDRNIHESSWERSRCLEVELDHLDKDAIFSSISLANKVKRSSSFDPENVMAFLRSTQLSFNQGFTNGAVVLFAKEPTYFLPQCTIRIVEFPEGKTGSKFGNTILIEDNFFKAFSEIQSYFKRSIPIISHFENSEWQRKDGYKYPLQALDEAIINALMHRDYSDNLGEVFISIYPDKIEIRNSGELPNHLTNSKLKKSHDSIPPNPTITHVVFLCGMIEKVGRGTVLIHEQFTELGLPAPYWESKNGFTKLTLYGEAKDVVLNYRMINFLKVLIRPVFVRQDYEDFFEGGISEKTARNDLSELIDAGLLLKIGKSSSTKYSRTEKKLPESAED